MKEKNWFNVSKEGLKQLQLGKPKHYVARELIANAFDEDIKVCKFDSEWNKGIAYISVEDDSPEGFRNLKDAFTLFAPTYKRANPEKRGRFNLGEKQALAICEKAKIETTKGTVMFEKMGRTQSGKKREAGSKISVELKMSKTEYDEMLEVVKNYLVPENIEFLINEVKIIYSKPYKTIRISLPTEIEENDILKKTLRMSEVNILKTDGKSFLYEMGIPVIETECQFGIDVQQKIPLSIDRDSVPHSYVAILYAEVLNATYENVKEDDSSQVWVREATANKRINSDAVKSIVNKRYGDKVVVANPFDKNSIDDAIAAGYKVITGNELSKEEWTNVRNSEAMSSSSDLFGSQSTFSEPYEPDENMKEVAELAKKIARKCLGIDIVVKFLKWDGNVAAQYGDRTLCFNVKKLKKTFFEPSLSSRTLDIILHELGHEKGNHTEKGYHETLTRMSGELIMLSLENKEFFSK